MTLQKLRDKMFNNEYENSLEGLKEFESDFVEVWEDRFKLTDEVFALGRGVFNTAREQAEDRVVGVRPISFNELLHHLCYGIFGFDLIGYYDMIDEAEEKVERLTLRDDLTFAYEPYYGGDVSDDDF